MSPSHFKPKPQIILILTIFIQISNSYIIDNNPYHHKETLDSKGRYTLEWLVDLSSKIITFNVTVKTIGFVGFGLSRDGRMAGADIVVGGVNPDGRSYFKDMHVLTDRSLKLDQKQDWKLLSALEGEEHTFLSFSRQFDTCDENDYVITHDHVQIIWSYGGSDQVGHHYQNRGSFSVFLLDPSVDPDINALMKQSNPASRGGPVQSFKLERKHRLRNKRTSYWCSMHAGPKLPHKHHIIGYRTILENEAARLHTHHLLIYRCKAPEGIDPQVLFEPFTRYSGEECYLNENRRLPIFTLCRDLVSVWAYGGKPFFLPETVGFPIGEEQNEYFLYESHFDNPDLRSDLEFETGVEYFFTPKTRQREGQTLFIGYDGPGSLAAIPPGSPAFDLVGHCNSNCTETMSPSSDGMDVVGMLLHTHVAGRKMRLRHFRGDQELSWLLHDDNYNPNFQQTRLLQEERKIMPGDHLIAQCTYDNTLNAGSTTITGFGSPDEMCMAFVIVANRIPYYRCTSEYPAQKLLSTFGIEDVIWDIERQQRLVTSPSSLKGLTLNQVADYHVHWTEELRQTLEKDMMYSPHVTTCPSSAVPDAQTFLASLSPEIAQRAASATPQELQQIVEQIVSQVIQFGTRGLRERQQGTTEPPNPGTGWVEPKQQQPTPTPTQVDFPQGFPPTGFAGLGVPPNAEFPKGAAIYQPPPSCKAAQPDPKLVFSRFSQNSKASNRAPNTLGFKG